MNVIATILIALALVVAIVPQFTDCESQGSSISLPNGQTIPMKCHWTGRAELAMSASLFAVGSLIVVNRRKQTVRALSILGIVLGISIALLPTVLIGVCGSEMMLCNMILKPTLVMAGILTVGTSLAGILLSREDAPMAFVRESTE